MAKTHNVIRTNPDRNINAHTVAQAVAYATDAGYAGINFIDAHSTALAELEERTCAFTLAVHELAACVALPDKIKSGPWLEIRNALLAPASGTTGKKTGGAADRLAQALRITAKSKGTVAFSQAFGEIQALEAAKKKAKRAAAAAPATPTSTDEPTEADADTSEAPKQGVTEKGKFRSLTIRSDAGAAEAFALLSAFAEKFGLAITLAE